MRTGFPQGAPFLPKIDEDILRLQFLYELSQVNLTVYEIGLEMLPAVLKGQSKASGLIFRPIIRGGIGTRLPFGPNFYIQPNAGAEVNNLLVTAVFPGHTEAASGQPTFNTSLEFASSFRTPRILLGSSQASRIELSNLSARLSMEGTPSNPEMQLRLKIVGAGDHSGGKAVIPLDESDSFVKETVKKTALEFSFGAEVVWSSQTGISLNGGALFEVTFPASVSLGALTLKNPHLVIGAGQKKTSYSTIELRLGTEILGKLGPINFVLDQMGFTLRAIPYRRQDVLNLPPGQAPLFGNLDLNLDFAPPRGIGLSINSGPFVGGGFLAFDPDDERYLGALELEFQDKIVLKAIGLLATRLPGGQPGYSLLIIITTEFTPLQLGLGFTLNGVGGLLGLNRTANAERLRIGLRENTLNNVLFPQNVVENASRILSELDLLFPAQEGRFIFGPMARIGWGTPTLITIDMGLLIEIPDPVRVLILGVIRALLPDEKAKLLQLQVNFLGEIDFESQRFFLDASLYNSKLLSYTLSGDMAVRLIWGNESNFLITAGGFHPAYQPPLKLPTLRRLSLQLIAGDNPRLTLETYFAISSNTVQFGAKAELLAKAGKFNVYGFLSFDVLFQFNPFYFIAQISAKLALRVGSSEIASISLDFTLEGPTPWHAKGTAKLKICWFLTVKVRFDKTFGEERNTRLDDIRVLPLLQAALSDPGNWEAQTPGSHRLLVSLKPVQANGQVLVYPFGVLTIQQRVVPLKIKIQRFGSQRSADGDFFAIEIVRAGQGNAAEDLDAAAVQEQFAPAQFFDLSDSQKLSSKSFERYASGVKLVDSEKLAADHAVRRVVEYDLHIIDAQREQTPRRKLILPDLMSFEQWAVGGAIASSPLSYARNRQSALAPGAVQVEQEKYAVVNTSDLRPVEEGSLATSEADARNLMAGFLRVNPALEGEILVVPAFEVNRS